jgi:hypothetical protein
MSLFLAILAAAMPQSTIIFRPFVAMETRQITLGTVADLSRLPEPLRSKARQIMLFQIPDGERYVRLPLIQIASRARSLFPALIPWLPRTPTGDVILARSVRSSVRMVATASAQGSIEAGSPVPSGSIWGQLPCKRVKKVDIFLQNHQQVNCFGWSVADNENAPFFRCNVLDCTRLVVG